MRGLAGTSIIYTCILQWRNKKHPSISHHTTKHQKTTSWEFHESEKPVIFLVATGWDGTLAPAKILLIEAPLQKLPFL